LSSPHTLLRLPTLLRPPPRSTLFPYTTLFRSVELQRRIRIRTADRQSGERVHPRPRVVSGQKSKCQHDVCHSCLHPVRPLCRSEDRKSTRLNSSHRTISYAVFCLKKKIKNNTK